MTILETYNKAKAEGNIHDGDFMLIHGTGFVAQTIQDFDSAVISHVLRVVKLHDRYLCIDSNSPGAHPEWLSSRLESYHADAKFCIIRSLADQFTIEQNVREFVKIKGETKPKYDFKNGLKEMINRVWMKHFKKRLFKITLDEMHDICSQLCRPSFEALKMGTKEFTNLEIVFPQDYVRYRNEFLTKFIIFEE